MSETLEAARRFWYNNEPGAFGLGQERITRREIQTHGGPSPVYDHCAVCQNREWLSRVRRRDLFQRHPGAKCPTEVENAGQCERQGNLAWSMYWQDFRFAERCDPALDAPRALLLLLDEPTADLWNRWRSPTCDAWMLGLRRKMAQACQIEVTRDPRGMDWGRYDFLFFMNTGHAPFPERPPLPILMYGHDMWRGDFQAALDRLQPKYFLTPCPTAWRRNFRFPQGTEVRFEAMPASNLFTRPNLDDRRKRYDLLVVGASKHPEFHAPRRELAAQVEPLVARWRVGFHLMAGGSRRDRCPGPVDGRNLFLNEWSAFLGSARYAVFGALGGRAEGILGFKYYELLGSGAVPILPDSSELPLLGVEPMVHYVPLSEIWRNNARLEDMLAHYDRHRPIAENAVRWHRENADRLLFDGFEAVVREVTDYKHPSRLL